MCPSLVSNPWPFGCEPDAVPLCHRGHNQSSVTDWCFVFLSFIFLGLWWWSISILLAHFICDHDNCTAYTKLLSIKCYISWRQGNILLLLSCHGVQHCLRIFRKPSYSQVVNHVRYVCMYVSFCHIKHLQVPVIHIKIDTIQFINI